jgi:trk system potassium uptake protein TrkA
VLRGSTVMLPKPDDVLEAGDEMLFVADGAGENAIRAIIHGTPARSDPLDPSS